MSGVIQLDHVDKRYRIYRHRYQSLKEVLVHRRLGEWQDHWALRDVSLEVEPGSTLGLVGANGAGKSTLLKLMAGILAPDRGTVRITGKVSALLELGAGFLLEYSGRENVYLNASLLGLSHREIDRRFDDIVAFAELEDEIEDPLRTYSSGMYMRLAFSTAIHVDPEVLLVDEILAVGDEQFQRKCLDWIERFQLRGGTIVMVSHNLGTVQQMCTEAAWVGDTRIQQYGPAKQVVDAYIDQVRAIERGLAEGEAAEPTQQLPDIQLGEASLVGREGPTKTIRSGDPLAIDIPYHVNRPLATPVFGVALFRNDGAHVYGTNTHIEEVPLKPLERDGSIRLSFPSLPLLAGTYRFTVGVFDRPKGGLPIDFQHQRYSFRVADSSDEEGVVRLPHEWVPGGVAAAGLGSETAT